MEEQLEIAERIVFDRKILEAEGYSVYAPKSIDEVPELMAQTGRKTQSAMLSLSNNDFTSSNSAFLFLMQSGVAVAGARSKLCDLGGETFESHQRRTVKQWYDLKEDRIVSIAKPLNDLIKGRHIYAGELEFHKDYRGRNKVTTAFVRVLVAASFQRWPDANCIYCILPEGHRRLAVDYGFNTTVRKAFTWRAPIPGGRLHDWMVAVSSRDQLIHDLIDGYWGSAQNEPE